MKKHSVLLLAGLFLLMNSLMAQSGIDPNRLRFGLQVSPSVSWLSSNDNQIEGDGSLLGLKLATQAEYAFTEEYSIATGIGFHFRAGGAVASRRIGTYFGESLEAGSPYEQQTVEGNVTNLEYRLQYVEIPVSLKLRTREFGYFRYYLEAPIFTFGIKTNARGDISGGGFTSGPNEENLDIGKEVNLFSLSWGLGGGVEYTVSESTLLFAGLQYNRVFTDITDDEDYFSSSSDPKVVMNNVTLRLGVLF